MQNQPQATDFDLRENAESLALARETRRIMRSGLITLAVMFTLFIGWSALAPLAEGVPSLGMVVIDTKRKPVQHLQGGRVDTVLVKEGQVVNAHDVLIRLDNKVATANFESARQEFFSLRASEGRLLAEQSGAAEITFDPELLATAQQDPQIAAQLAVQRQLMKSRRESLKAQTDALNNKIAAETARIKSFEQAQRSSEIQTRLVSEELNALLPMVKEGYASRNQQIELEMNLSRAQSALADAIASARSSQEAVEEARAQISTLRSEYSKEVENTMAQVRRDVRAAEERYRAASGELEATVIRAPVAGQVVGIVAQAKGAVIHPGEKIMDIVPGDEGLLIEAKVPPYLIDRVAPGQPADIRFTNFAHSPTLVVEGRIKTISTDVLADEQSKLTYYLARVQVTEDGLRNLGNRKLQPGMQPEVIFRTGSRTLLNYLLHPLIKRLASSMVEE